jgi:uncharacterized phage-associated protein
MNNKSYTPRNIADWFLCQVDRDAGDSITHKKLQKLVYYAQAWSLALNGRPLFNDELQAWRHGPVPRDLFDSFSGNGWQALPLPDQDKCSACNRLIADDDVALLEEVIEIYGGLTASRLEALTHNEEPWLEARAGLPLEASCTTNISKTTMKKFYSELNNASA